MSDPERKSSSSCHDINRLSLLEGQETALPTGYWTSRTVSRFLSLLLVSLYQSKLHLYLYTRFHKCLLWEQWDSSCKASISTGWKVCLVKYNNIQRESIVLIEMFAEDTGTHKSEREREEGRTYWENIRTDGIHSKRIHKVRLHYFMITWLHGQVLSETGLLLITNCDWADISTIL